MPVVNFLGVPEAGDFSPLDGQYLACVRSVETERDGRPRQTSEGFPIWNAKFTVCSGERVGANFWDTWAFSPNAMKRLKLICSRVAGVPVDGKVDIQPDLFIGKYVLVDCKPNSYVNSEGDTKTNTKVEFAGYHTASDSDVAHGKEMMVKIIASEDAEAGAAPAPEANSQPDPDDDIPF